MKTMNENEKNESMAEMTDTKTPVVSQITEQSAIGESTAQVSAQTPVDESNPQNPPGIIGLAIGENWTSYVLVGLGLLAVLGITVFIAGKWIEWEAKKLTQNFNLDFKNVDSKEVFECKVVTNKDQREFIKQQRSKVINYGNAHQISALAFYKYFYGTFVVLSLFSVLSVISFAIIFYKKGNGEISPHLITVFMITTGIVVLYQGFFGVFQHKANMENHSKLYFGYAKLLEEINTYCVTEKTSITDPSIMLNTIASQTKREESKANSAIQTNINQTNTNKANTATPTNVANNATKAPETSMASKPSPFYIKLEADEFINYVSWHMRQIPAFSITFDDKQAATGIDNSKFIGL